MDNLKIQGLRAGHRVLSGQCPDVGERFSRAERTLLLFLVGLVVCCASGGAPGRLKAQDSAIFQPGDRIAIIGNTLAERMQWDGWLETRLHLQFPEHHFVIRNLGFSGDEIDTRLRSKGFGTPDEHLSRFRADVVLMMFGFNESFAGPDKAPEFGQRVAAEIARMRSRLYNGRTPPRLAIVSPVAAFDTDNDSLPAATVANARLAPYVAALREAACAARVPFVDLFEPSRQWKELPGEPLTINGIHLTAAGNRMAAEEIVRQLCGDPVVAEGDRVGLVRAAVQDLNWHWFHCYRTTDGYSIFGDRGELAFVDGQTNREVLTRELEILAAMADRRDPVVWAAVRGERIKADDAGLPPPIEVRSNIPGPLPDGSHLFLDPEESIRQLTVLDGFRVELFASEREFPELVNPVQMSWDSRGRLWVAVWPTYPHWQPGTEMNDKLLILEDTDGDGRADRCIPFATGLHNPTGFEFWNGGVIVASQPDLVFLRDTDGDDRADIRQQIMHGIDSADTHHAVNSFVFGPDGALYFQEGTFHHTQIETPWGLVRSANAASYRFEPGSWRLSVYTPYPYANPHGHVFDRWGQDILHDGTGSDPFDAALISGRLEHPAKHRAAPKVYQPRTRPCPATELVSSRNFPAEMDGELLVANVIGDLGILRYAIRPDGSSITGTELQPLLVSRDSRFRPVDMEFAPDGSLYFLDWHNPIIGHMQHNLRDPNRDRSHGRVFRVVCEGHPLEALSSESGLTVEQLVDRLLEPEANRRDRYRVRIELTARPLDEVRRIVSARTAAGVALESWQELELLWLTQQVQRLDTGLLEKCLASAEPPVRAAAVRSLTDWAGRLDREMVQGWMLAAARDEHPRIRLLAARGASFQAGDDGLAVIGEVAARDRDRYLDYVLEESLRAMPRGWQTRLAGSGILDSLSAAGRDYLLEKLSPEQRAALPVNEATAGFLLVASGVPVSQRERAASLLAAQQGCSIAQLIADQLPKLGVDGASVTVAAELAGMLASRPATELAEVRPLLEKLAFGADGRLRRTGLLGLLQADGDVEAVYRRSLGSAGSMMALGRTVEAITDNRLQQQLFDRLAEALQRPPQPLTDALAAAGLRGNARTVRISLPGDGRILTLAEVEVWSGGSNVALDGEATQSSTANGGEAGRGIDGNKSGAWDRGGQTHTAEVTSDPWWEVRLAEPCAVDRIVVFNRTDDRLGRRLEGFQVQVFDDDGNVLFGLSGQPAPDPIAEIPVRLTSPAVLVRRALLEGVSHVRGRAREAFALLAGELCNGDEVALASRGLLRIPSEAWDPALAPDLIQRIEGLLVAMSEADRESDLAGRLLEVGQRAVALLPAEQRPGLAARLSALAIPVLTVGTRPQRMEYDRTVLAIEPNRRVVIVLENQDEMPHNLVLLRPGSLEAVGLRAESESTDPAAIGRGYVPQSDDVLAATGLVQMRQSTRLSFVSPSEPGVYPFVCTYPGHWRRMTGALYVVPDVAAFLADPAGYSEAGGIRIRDELLMRSAARTEWKIEDFADDLAAADAAALPAGLVGRDFERGRSLFRTASCSSCHKLAGDGFALGPDLAELDPSWSPADILRHILVPSERIDERYRTVVLLLASGNTVSGIVTREDDETIVLTDNPLQAAAEREIDKADIDDRSLSAVSMMPLGLMDTLSRSDVLDLLAYVIARGDPDAALFRTDVPQR